MTRLFVYLDQCENDFRQFQLRFSRQTHSKVHQWVFFSQDDECRQYLQKAIALSREIIFITSGRLGIDLIEHFHSHPQIHSIYIYCQNICKYKRFGQSYRKILGIHSNPNELLRMLIENLAEETSSFDQRLTDWDPWRNEVPSAELPPTDPTILSLVQTDSIPLKIVFSSVDQLEQIGHENVFSLHFDLQRSSVTLGTHRDGRVDLLASTQKIDEVLQPNESRGELRYWLVLWKSEGRISFGLGEIRLGFEVLRADFPAVPLSHFHLVFLGSPAEDLKSRFRLSFGSFPLIEPDLFVRTRRKLDGNPTETFHSGLTVESFPSASRTLFHQLTNFKLVDLDFPSLISAIESSCRQPTGFCSQIFANKSNIGSIRLRKNAFLLEIFPPGFSSSIRNYRHASGFLRVLHGSIFVRLFPFLSSNSGSARSPREFLLHRDDITWTQPQWNQTQQMKNVEFNSLAIVLQIFRSDRDDEENALSFDYLQPESRTIRRRTKTVDLSFDEFKEKMKREWNEKHP